MAGKRSSVVIAGGGIGGIATALALAKYDIESQVYERRAGFPEEGAGIQIGPNGTRILSDLGVADVLRAHAAVPDALSARDGSTGQELTRLPLGTWIAERHGSPYWTAHRKDLHNALRMRAEADPRITLKCGCEIVSFVNEADGIRAIGAAGDVIEGQALVCADGLWSDLRKKMGASSVPQPVGKTAFRSVTPASDLPPELTPNAVHIWLAPGAHVVHYPVNAGRDIALVVITDDTSREAGWERPALAQTVQDSVRNFSMPLQDLVAKAQDWRRWSLYAMPPLQHWSVGRATLLGDAAHPVLPFLAQGAVLALEDAKMLACCLAGERHDVATALKNYEHARWRRAKRVAETSRRNGRIYHMSGALALARNATMRLTRPARMMAGFDWLYGWRL
jgi:salicylate hydroxylase